MEKMRSDKGFGIRMLSYHTTRGKCFEAYNRLCGILPTDLILDYETSLTFPARFQLDFGVPPEMKSLCRNRLPKNQNDRRLFFRILEYVEAADKNMSCSDLLETTEKLYMNQYIRKQFSDFFRFSILYRNKRDKVIAAVHKK